MTVLNIYSLDDPNEQHLVASLGVGSHVIGRGALLQVADKRVSRKHAIIEVTDTKIILTSIHINPCFFKAANSRSLIVITQNKNNEINDGDQFALLPEHCWYKVKIKTEEPDEPHETGKRVHETENNNSFDAKKARLCTDASQTALETTINGSTTELCSTENMESELSTLPNVEGSPEASIDVEAHEVLVPLEIKEELLELTQLVEANEVGLARAESSVPQTLPNVEHNSEASIDVEAHEVLVPVEIKEELLELTQLVEANEVGLARAESSVPQAVEIKIEPAEGDIKDSTDHSTVKDQENADPHILPVEVGPSTSGTANVQTRGPRREKCWYGETCYRKNAEHALKFSHPGDQDYSGGEDDQEQCPYGSACYRRNTQHRRQYRHDSRPAPAIPPTAKRRKKSPLMKNDDSEDDYDYSDPFLNDDSGEDYDPSDYGIESSESDFDDSQEVDESQERRRMMREAKKIIKRKN